MLCARLGEFSPLYPVPVLSGVFEEGNGRNKNQPLFGMVAHFVVEEPFRV